MFTELASIKSGTKTGLSLRSEASTRTSGCPLDAYLPPDLGETPLLVLSPSAAQCLITPSDINVDGPSVSTTRRLLAEARAVMARLNTDHVDVALPRRRTSPSPTRGVSLDVQLSCSQERHHKPHRSRHSPDRPSPRRVSQSRGRMDLPSGDRDAHIGVDETPVLQAFASNSTHPIKQHRESLGRAQHREEENRAARTIPEVQKRPSMPCPLHPPLPRLEDYLPNCRHDPDSPNAAVHAVCRSPEDGVHANAKLLEVVCPREDSNVSVLEVVRSPDEEEVRVRRMMSQRLPSLSIRRGCTVQVGPSFQLDSIEVPVSNMSVVSVARLEVTDAPSATIGPAAGPATEAVTRAVAVLTARLARLEDRGLASAERVEGLLGRLTDGVGKLAEGGGGKVDTDEEERQHFEDKHRCREHKASPPPRRPRRPLEVSSPSYVNIPPTQRTSASAQCSPEPPLPLPVPTVTVETLEELSGRVHALSSQFRRLSEAVAPSAALRVLTSTETIPSSDTRPSTDLSGPSNTSLLGLRLTAKSNRTTDTCDLDRVSEESLHALKLASLTEPATSLRDVHFQENVGQTVEIVEAATDEGSDESNAIVEPLISPVPSRIRSPPHLSPRSSSQTTPTLSPLKNPAATHTVSPQHSPAVSPTRRPIGSGLGFKPRQPVEKHQTVPQSIRRQITDSQPMGKQKFGRGVSSWIKGRPVSVLGLAGTTSPTRHAADLVRNVPALVSRSPARTSITSSKTSSSRTGQLMHSKPWVLNQARQSKDSSQDSNTRSSRTSQPNMSPRERRRASREGMPGRQSSSPSEAGTSASSLSEGEVRSVGEVRPSRRQHNLSEGQLLSLGEVPTCESSNTSEQHSLRQSEDVYSIPKMLQLEMQMDHEQTLSRFTDML